MRPSLKSRSCERSWRSASFRPTSACVTPALTSDSDWAWVTSGSTSARMSPDFTTAPSRTFRATTRPDTADFTSTFVSGSTTPTSRTLTWRSSACTFPSRNGGSGSLALTFPRGAKTTPPPARRITPADARIHLSFFDMRDLSSGYTEVRSKGSTASPYNPPDGRGADPTAHGRGAADRGEGRDERDHARRRRGRAGVPVRAHRVRREPEETGAACSDRFLGRRGTRGATAAPGKEAGLAHPQAGLRRHRAEPAHVRVRRGLREDGRSHRAGPSHRRRLHRPDAFSKSLGDAREALRAGCRADPERERHGLDAGAGVARRQGRARPFRRQRPALGARHEQGEGGRPRHPLRRGRPLHGQSGARPRGHAHPARPGDHGRDRAVRRRRKRARPRRHGLETGRSEDRDGFGRRRGHRERPDARRPRPALRGRADRNTLRAEGGDEREMTEEPLGIARRARLAARQLATLSPETKGLALRKVADGIDAARDVILEANRADVLAARTTFEENLLAPSAFERLKLDGTKVQGMADGVRAVAALPDPSGVVLSRTLLDDGLVLEKVTCPLGVLLVIRS